MNSLLQNQNEPELIKMLKASAVSYKKAKYWEIRITYFFITLAFAYPVVFVIIHNETVRLSLLLCSFILAILAQIFYNTFRGNTSEGALFKEEFDVILFGRRWKSTLKQVNHKEISRLSIQYEGAELRDWYSMSLSTNIPESIAIAICQYSNTCWDIDLRKKYLDWLRGFIIAYSIGLFVFFVVMNVNGLIIFSTCLSITSFYTHFFTLIRGHSSVVEKREAISKILDELILKKKAISMEELRDIQDDIFITRQEPAKVPNFFFRLYKKKLNDEFEDYIESVNKAYS